MMFKSYTLKCDSCKSNYHRGLDAGREQQLKHLKDAIDELRHDQESLRKEQREWDEIKATYALKVIKEYLPR